MTRALLIIAVLIAAAGCGIADDVDAGASGVAERPRSARPPVSTLPRFAAYEPDSSEPYREAKRVAGRAVQALTTYRLGVRPGALAAKVVDSGAQTDEIARALAPVVLSGRRSAGEILYAQLSGVTSTTFGAMVLVRQHLEDTQGRRASVTRVVDVRLRSSDRGWRLESIASFGGRPVSRPATLSPAATRVLDHPGIELPDTARWDIHRGLIDEGLLVALSEAADRRAIAVLVLRTGHPANVWATSRPSAHTSGFAADLYAVAGTLVVRQRGAASPARQLAAELIEAGAVQVGSPFALPPGGRRSFTDEVHQDHIHVQQTSTG